MKYTYLRYCYRYLFFVAFVLLVQTATAQDSTRRTAANSKFFIKGYPLAIAINQLPQYCALLRGGFEYRVTQHHSLHLGIGYYFPNYILVGFSNLWDGGPPLFFTGGMGSVGYRYRFAPKRKGHTAYIGFDAVIGGLVSQKRQENFDQYENPYFPYFHPPVHRARAILTNYSVAAGYTFVKKHWIFELGGSIGYKYQYFWRQYPQGNVEFPREEYYQSVRRFPVGFSIDFALGGWL